LVPQEFPVPWQADDSGVKIFKIAAVNWSPLIGEQEEIEARLPLKTAEETDDVAIVGDRLR
jgi:hypothetical protein